MAQRANCKRCRFEFFGGHDHHSGSSCALCVTCLSAFTLLTENPWGPSLGERIQLLLGGTALRRKKRKRNRLVDYTYHSPPIETGVYITIGSETEAFDDSEHAYPIYLVENLACPQCSKSTIVVGFEPDDACPECGEDSLNLDAIIY